MVLVFMGDRAKIAILINTYEPYFRKAALGIIAYAKLHGWLLRTEFMHECSISDLIEHEVQGAIASIGYRSELREPVQRSGVPTVNIWASLEYPEIPQVLPDHEAVGEMVVSELIERGFSSLAYCGPMPERAPALHEMGYYSTQRGRGFLRGAAARGITAATFTDAATLRRPWDEVATTAPLGEWLATLPKPCGIMICDDSYASRIYAHCEARGMHIPEEVAVVGVNNDEVLCELFSPSLSSVQLAAEQVGHAAAELLAALMAGKPKPKKPILIPPLLLVRRRSSDVYAMAETDVAAAVRFIHSRADRPLMVQDVLKEIPVSERWLQIRFQKVLKRTIQQEICRAHVERAKTLLVESEAPMPVVAEKSGYSTAARLSEVFRREVGTTPTAYRRQHREAF